MQLVFSSYNGLAGCVVLCRVWLSKKQRGFSGTRGLEKWWLVWLRVVASEQTTYWWPCICASSQRPQYKLPLQRAVRERGLVVINTRHSDDSASFWGLQAREERRIRRKRRMWITHTRKQTHTHTDTQWKFRPCLKQFETFHLKVFGPPQQYWITLVLTGWLLKNTRKISALQKMENIVS